MDAHGYLPLQGFFSPQGCPHTGEKLLWFWDYTFWGARTQDYAEYTPVANRRFAQVVIKYNNNPGKWKPPDCYQYIPSFMWIQGVGL